MATEQMDVSLTAMDSENRRAEEALRHETARTALLSTLVACGDRRLSNVCDFVQQLTGIYSADVQMTAERMRVDEEPIVRNDAWQLNAENPAMQILLHEPGGPDLVIGDRELPYLALRVIVNRWIDLEEGLPALRETMGQYQANFYTTSKAH